MTLIAAAAALLLLLVQVPVQVPSRGAHDLVLPAAEVGEVLYGLSIPEDYDAAVPRPLVLALHPGGPRMRYYGSAFMRQVVAPGLRDLRPIIVAPDCPAGSWTDPAADAAAMAVVRYALDHFAIDRRRILVVGFSMGGRGTWFLSSRHPEVFTAAIPVAAPAAGEPLDRLATMPTYVIHSRDDQVVPFAPAEKNARDLQALGRVVRFDALTGPSHYEMAGYVAALRRAGRWIADRWKE